MWLEKKKIFVLGLGISGIAACKTLSKLGAEIICYDDKKQDPKITNVTYQSYNEVNWQQINYLILSPGIPSTFPKPHEAVNLARKAECKIICDVEMLFLLARNAYFITVTGTNGKSTTASLIYDILKKSGKNVQLGGNIGKAALDLEISDQMIYVLELSSYQLELLDQAEFDISVLLNITPDHIDRHGNMENYVAAKKRIFRSQKRNNYAVIGVDDSYSKEIYENITTDKISFLASDAKDQISKYILNCGNPQNILASLFVADKVGIDPKLALKFVADFRALPHRMQFLSTYKNINFYNDSKATNAESTANALQGLDNIYWIAGGVAKEGGIEKLLPQLDKIEKVFLIGEAKEYFQKQLDNKVDSEIFDSLEDAFNMACDKALKETQKINLLFSPACASFDMWQNYVARGNDFCHLVKNKVAS